ncbi:unnamed protein product [Kuraishia capsulata CBS 1993]|uniref:Probable beta-glucosidase M n=1 Tax=Kuraishia capsulata CBS 1993 TaxID=1382522 RepID=W6MN35_9ASCO|nr:uncharacterized protein KUCA_T00004009001 [Kuraishia capsulata CBS 1993]CDK28029.1 unnamed protein product [Kuraishia capsulata CBS 1993]
MKLSILAASACVARLSSFASAESISEKELANLEHWWSYNRSEAVYPSPVMAGSGNWEFAYNKAVEIVSQMTNEEKVNLTFGYTSETTGCSGMIPGVPDLGFEGMCFQDAGNGVRGTDMVNSYASGVHVGAAWNKQLAYDRAYYMGAEFKRKGVNVHLGPVVGPVGRLATGGRNWEGFSSDPYLTGSLAAETISGLQKNVIACVKHFVAYEQETNRNPPLLAPKLHNQSVSSNLDDKTMHEVYLWPFYDAVKAGAGSVMGSYNRINNSYACQNSKTLNGLLKTELGFEGFVVSDWDGQHTGIASANAGLDMAMPDSVYWEDGLLEAVKNGTVSQERLDDMATRIVAAWYKYARLDDPGHGLPVSILDPHELIDARDPNSKSTIFQGAVEGHVLVKNADNALPLKKPKFLSLFGYDGIAAEINNQGEGSLSLFSLGFLNTLQYENGTIVDPDILMDIFLSSYSAGSKGPGVALNGTLYTGGGSGSNTPSYIDAPFNAFTQKAYEDGTFLSWDFSTPEPLVNPASEACIVFINAMSTEGYDRPHLRDPYSDNLVESVADQCANTIVVIHNAGIRLVDKWIDHENVTAVIMAHLPGQDTGRALVEVMYGKQSPSGRLPYTVAKNESDYGSLLYPTTPEGDLDLYFPQSNFTEGVYIDYKSFIKRNVTPRYEFGYGLTYTTFDYSNLEIQTVTSNHSYLPPDDIVLEGGLASLWDVLASVKVTVTNTGDVTAAEVAQLYVGIPHGPKKVLRGYGKQSIQPGESAEYVFDLTRRDLSTWDVITQNWVLQAGSYPVYVGKSVLDIQLTGKLEFTN